MHFFIALKILVIGFLIGGLVMLFTVLRDNKAQNSAIQAAPKYFSLALHFFIWISILVAVIFFSMYLMTLIL
jgi:hypothetical protein